MKSKKNKSGSGDVIAFFLMLSFIGWVLREAGIIKDDFREESIHWEACQCKDEHAEQVFWLRAPEEREEEILNKILPKFGLSIKDGADT